MQYLPVLDPYKRYSCYVANSTECVRIKLVRARHDLIEDIQAISIEHLDNKHLLKFKPASSYQIFGDNENIFGYSNLLVKVYYTCSCLNIFVGLNFADMLDPEITNGVVADDILNIIKTKFGTSFSVNIDDYFMNIEEEEYFEPYGELIKNFTIKNLPGTAGFPENTRRFCIYKADNSVPDFLPYHSRMQTLLLWFIDDISFIDIEEDDKWDVFMLYEIFPDNQIRLFRIKYCFVGYATVYRYYNYPDKIRPRISQFLILPPFQRMTLGSTLLETILDNYNNDSVMDITVEQPSEEFQRMRDIVCCKSCTKLESFSEENLKKGWSEEMALEARKKLKIHPKQTRRLYEILKLFKLSLFNTPEYAGFVDEIKNRLNYSYQRQLNFMEKLLKNNIISEEKYQSLLRENMVPKDYHVQNLNKKFEEIEKEYLTIVDKLKQIL